MRANRRKFSLLVLSKRRNDTIAGGSTPYLHPVRQPNSFQTAKSMPYSCGKKSIMKKSIVKASRSKQMTMKKKCVKSKK